MCPLFKSIIRKVLKGPLILPPGVSVIGQLQAVWKAALPCYLDVSSVRVLQMMGKGAWRLLKSTR